MGEVRATVSTYAEALGWTRVGSGLVTDRLVWIDCEMTGLDIRADALVEVAALVTDFDLNVLGDGVDVVIKPPPEALDQMIEFVRNMHVSSGLIEELDSGTTIEDAQAQVLAYVKEHCPSGSRPPLAGNTVATDRAFLARDMPELEQFLHYRIVDVSSIKELSRRWFPRAYYNSPAKSGNHRALADIRESIEELRYYREAVFVPSPGPDAAGSKTIAARHQGSLTGERPVTERGLNTGYTLASQESMVGIAQLVERRLVVADVAGSSPVTHPKRSSPWPQRCGQGLDRVPALSVAGVIVAA